MATYKEIKGATVQTRDSDPVENIGSWAAGGNMNTARRVHLGVGITTAGLAAAGQTGPGGSVTAESEQYNGTSWTTVAEMNTARYGIAGIGTYTAAIGASGYTTTIQSAVESWDGSSWTEIAELNQPRFYAGSSRQGSSTAGIVFGGSDGSPEDKTESWNGSAWTEVNDLPTVRTYPASIGTSTAALATGAFQSPSTYPNSTDQWDGTSWTNLSVTQNTTRSVANAINAGSTTSALIAGGQSPGATANTEVWDGSAWTEVNNLSAAQETIVGAGASSSEAWGSGGDTVIANTEEWAFPPPTAALLTEGSIFLSGGTALKGFGRAAGIPAATWSSGGSLNTGRFGLGAAGSQTANLVFAGGIPSPPQTNITESYNGTSWTEVNDMQRSTAVYLAGTGTQTAALGMAGENTTVRLSVVESWDGTNWTEIADVNTARGTAGAAGTQTAAFLVGGDASPGAFAGTELWNGSSWTEVNNLNTARNGINATMGTQTEALVAGGYQHRTVVESWDGTSWTETTDINTGRGYSGGSGSQTFALVSGGQKSPSNTASANTEFWNGSSWTEVNDLSTARMYVGGSPTGSAALALITGGHPPYYTSTEEWTADATLSTVTVS